MKKHILWLVFLTSFGPIYAQKLARKAGLGVGYYQQIPDSLKARYPFTNGALIKFVIANSTADKAGLKPGDWVISLNGKQIQQPSSLAIIARNLRAGERVELLVNRHNQALKLSGIAQEKPKELNSDFARIEYGEFAYSNGLVRTIMASPIGKKCIGTIYFLQGLPCYSMDNFQANDKTKQAIDALVKKGYAVYRMEKADMGDNYNQATCETMGFNDELAMYRAGYKHLISLPSVDKSKISLFGHSMGGVVAPLLAQEFQPFAVIVYGTVFKSWADYMLDAYRLQLRHYGEDLSWINDSLESFKPYLYAYFYENKTVQEICKEPMGLQALSNVLGYDPATGLGASGRSLQVFKEINEHNLAKAWKNTQSHVLAIYGECDIAAIHPTDHQDLIRYVNQQHPGKGTFWLAPKTTHTFEEIGTMEEFVQWQSQPQAFASYAAGRFNAAVFDYIGQWLGSRE